MLEKVRLPRDVMWRWCVFMSLACLLAYLVGQISKPDVVYVDLESRWCLYGTYNSADDVESDAAKPKDIFINFNNGDVNVYANCQEIK